MKIATTGAAAVLTVVLARAVPAADTASREPAAEDCSSQSCGDRAEVGRASSNQSVATQDLPSLTKEGIEGCLKSSSGCSGKFKKAGTPEEISDAIREAGRVQCPQCGRAGAIARDFAVARIAEEVTGTPLGAVYKGNGSGEIDLSQRQLLPLSGAVELASAKSGNTGTDFFVLRPGQIDPYARTSLDGPDPHVVKFFSDGSTRTDPRSLARDSTFSCGAYSRCADLIGVAAAPFVFRGRR
ncbi:MAG: hypothetical protein HY059_09440 [Proteobacteria bacterium]|nr:hypothetical protein [Pseudomonadota bacterium]